MPAVPPAAAPLLEAGVLTLFPEMFGALTGSGVSARALRQGLWQLHLCNPRDHARDRHRSVDDRPYGGGPGMVMMGEPLLAALEQCRAAMHREGAPAPRVVHLSPAGRRLDHAGVRALLEHGRVILVCGRYEAIDERFVECHVDEELSIGDYVLSGGELAAMVLLDAAVRLLPGALGGEASSEQDSFVAGLLDCPHYTRPEVLWGRAVPPVLLSGDHAAIARWRREQGRRRTRERRPDLLEGTDAPDRDGDD